MTLVEKKPRLKKVFMVTVRVMGHGSRKLTTWPLASIAMWVNVVITAVWHVTRKPLICSIDRKSVDFLWHLPEILYWGSLHLFSPVVYSTVWRVYRKRGVSSELFARWHQTWLCINAYCTGNSRWCMSVWYEGSPPFSLRPSVDNNCFNFVALSLLTCMDHQVANRYQWVKHALNNRRKRF